MKEPPAAPAPMLRSVGANIRSRRKALGMTLEHLEESSGVGAAFIGQIERAIKKPSLETLHALAAALDVPVASFFDGGGLPPQRTESERLAALLRAHDERERELIYGTLRHLSRRLIALRRP